MSNFLCFSMQFLDPEPAFHGKRDGGEPEWPPSPLRLYQALVDAATNRWRNAQFVEYAKPALEWLQQLKPPMILAPAYQVGIPFRTAVPDNDLDVWASSISKGNVPKKQPNDLKSMKTVRRTRLLGAKPNDNAVQYLFPLIDGSCPHLEVLRTAARSITHLGWGIDMVAGNAIVITEGEAAKLPGEQWRPAADAGATGYRVPIHGTLDDLVGKHEAFLNRLPGNGFRPVPPLSAFRLIGYRRATDSVERPSVAFELWKPLAALAELPSGKSKFRPFDTPRLCATVAGMARCAAKKAAANWNEEMRKTFILGHGDGTNGQATTNDRLMYLPLPSITPLRVESIRRLLVVGPSGSRAEINHLRQMLSGQELVRFQNPDPIAMLSVISSTDRNVTPYTRSSATWTTVTPVVLPGYDDPSHLRRRLGKPTVQAEEQKRLLGRLDDRIDNLLRKAIRQAGFSNELARDAQIEWRTTGFRSGVDVVSRYCIPKHLQRFSRYHVKITWRDASGHSIPLNGPLALGGGRFSGLGLFVAIDG